MGFYELLCITRTGLSHADFTNLVKITATHILERGGVVRGFENWGVLPLPTKTRRHQVYHTNGQFWLMHFDTNPVVLHELRRKLNIDTRVIRGNLVKLGEKLEDIIERPDKTK
ncbi:3739_t:CDS:2 [Entrophospora sp. SA101]|nr:984_t:CDS:2 [Entrophospora candida]CAH1758188.1 1817_t:CDS:2 [Entrophospora sp. SA101]CAG8483873.1 3022_t:CDS:2 [Entrophospora candida]CAJ0761725.1 3739_t:CDS:2 [Entrophospora sp. SA101]CAJ0846064.1 6238_t:CDS:2 [Entrophospora sp. SA101]